MRRAQLIPCSAIILEIASSLRGLAGFSPFIISTILSRTLADDISPFPAELVNLLLKKYFQQTFDQVANGQVDTWDTQLQYLLWQKKQLVATSSNNLIKNIGWADGTHAEKKDHNHDLPTGEIKFPMDHPENFERDIKADQIIEQKSYRITKLSYAKNCFKKLIQ